jgi:hypothetical protein
LARGEFRPFAPPEKIAAMTFGVFAVQFRKSA